MMIRPQQHSNCEATPDLGNKTTINGKTTHSPSPKTFLNMLSNTNWFEQMRNQACFINSSKITTSKTKPKKNCLELVSVSQSDDPTEDCTEVEEEEYTSLLSLPKEGHVVRQAEKQAIVNWIKIKTECEGILDACSTLQQHQQQNDYHNNNDMDQSSFPFLLRNEEEDVDSDEYSDDDDMIHVLYNGHGKIRETTASVMKTARPSSYIGFVNNNSNGSRRNNDENKIMHHQHIMYHIIDQQFHNILYMKHGIYDINIYTSILVLLLCYDSGNCCVNDKTMRCDSRSSISVDDAIRIIATYLIDPSVSCMSKYAILRILILESLDDQYQQQLLASQRQNYQIQTTKQWMVGQQHQQGYNADDNHDSNELLLRKLYAFCVAVYFGEQNFYDDYPNCCPSQTDVIMPASNSTKHFVVALCPMLWELRSKCLYLQELYTIYDDIAILTPYKNVTIASTTVEVSEEHRKWEYVKNYCYDHDSILLKDMDLLYTFFTAILNSQVKHTIVIASIGYVRICTYHDTSMNNKTCSITSKNYYKYSEAVRNISYFLSDFKIQRQWKMACLFCLLFNNDAINIPLYRSRIMKLSPSTLLSQLQLTNKKHKTYSSTTDDDIYYSKVLSFCTSENSNTDSFLISAQQPRTLDRPGITTRLSNSDHNHGEEIILVDTSCNALLLLWEIRILCSYFRKERLEQRQRRSKFLRQMLPKLKSMMVDVAQQSKYHMCNTIIIPMKRTTDIYAFRTKMDEMKNVLNSNIRHWYARYRGNDIP